MKHPGAIIRSIRATEKGTLLSSTQNQYQVRVATDANKIEIKQAVEAHFNVSVTAVNTMNYRGKTRITRNRKLTRKPDWKRAVVTLKAGDRIDVI